MKKIFFQMVAKCAPFKIIKNIINNLCDLTLFHDEFKKDERDRLTADTLANHIIGAGSSHVGWIFF